MGAGVGEDVGYGIRRRSRGPVGSFSAGCHPAVSLLTTMLGLSDTAAAAIVAEIGDDMSTFPSAGHLLSWAGLCPRVDESAGKRRSTRTRQGAPWLKTTLVHTAWAASRCGGVNSGPRVAERAVAAAKVA